MKLHHKVNSLQTEVDALKEGILDLEIYLTSEKFSQDPTVQVADVQRRLMAIETYAIDRKYEQEEKDWQEAIKKEALNDIT